MADAATINAALCQPGKHPPIGNRGATAGGWWVEWRAADHTGQLCHYTGHEISQADAGRMAATMVAAGAHDVRVMTRP